MNHTWIAMITKKNVITESYCQLVNNIGQSMSFQPVFEASKNFASSIIYGESIIYPGTRVCNTLHSWS